VATVFEIEILRTPRQMGMVRMNDYYGAVYCNKHVSFFALEVLRRKRTGPSWMMAILCQTRQTERRRTLFFQVPGFVLLCFGGGSFSDDTVTVGMSNSRFELPIIELASWLSWWPPGYCTVYSNLHTFILCPRGISWELVSTLWSPVHEFRIPEGLVCHERVLVPVVVINDPNTK
jgi:hypothetical protein